MREPAGPLDLIGGTRVLPLRRLAPAGGARILLKLETENPTGSMKDRMARAMVEGAERAGRLQSGGAVVEYTGGSTGVSLAFVCAAKGLPLHIVTSDAYSREKRDHMAALGARLTLIPSADGGTTRELTLAMIDKARELAAAPGSCWMDQLNNADQLDGYVAMADEILAQTGGRVDAFVQCVGTGGSLRGVATRLKERGCGARIVAVEPAESAVLSGRPPGSHRIEGVGAGFVVPLWRPDLVDSIETVGSDEAAAMARELARTEGVFAGTSTGANVMVARRVAATLPPEAVVVTVAVDSGMKYLSSIHSGGDA